MLTLCRANGKARVEFISPPGTPRPRRREGPGLAWRSLCSLWSRGGAKSVSDFPKNHGHFRENLSTLTLFSRNFRDNFFWRKGPKRGKPAALLTDRCKFCQNRCKRLGVNALRIYLVRAWQSLSKSVKVIVSLQSIRRRCFSLRSMHLSLTGFGVKKSSLIRLDPS